MAAPWQKLVAPALIFVSSQRDHNRFLPERSIQKRCGACLQRLAMSAESRPDPVLNRSPSEHAVRLRTGARPAEICNASGSNHRTAIRRQGKHRKSWEDSCRNLRSIKDKRQAHRIKPVEPTKPIRLSRPFLCGCSVGASSGHALLVSENPKLLSIFTSNGYGGDIANRA